MIHEDLTALRAGWEGILRVDGRDVQVLDADALRETLVDTLVWTAVFSADQDTRDAARWAIRRAGAAMGVIPASIHTLYEAMGRGEAAGFTVPAINIRGLTYDVAQAVFRAARERRVGAILFEIARSEIDYTRQRPAEYAAAVTAAAVKIGWRGPLFLQGDHFQVNAKRFAADPDKEVKAVKDLVWEAIDAGLYNIDVDTSTLVDLAKPTVREQQTLNYTLAAELTTMIRDLEPTGVTVSVGGEIGEVGGKNSTIEELDAYMEGLREELAKTGEARPGISKISVQTGTTHGGVPLADGTVARVKLDFETLEKLSTAARSRWGLAGAVQHGASTLPDEAFDRFPATGTAEIHLATGFQNIIYESKHFPADLREGIYAHLAAACANEKKDTDTNEQFLYKTRKKGFGFFKRELWDLPPDVRRAIGGELERQFAFLFGKLRMTDTVDVVQRHVLPVDVAVDPPAGLR